MTERDRWTAEWKAKFDFHAEVGDLVIDAVKGQYDESIVTIKYPTGYTLTLHGVVPFPIRHALRFNDSRLLLFEEGFDHQAVIVDIVSAAVLDEFHLGKAAVSPTNRFIAFRLIVPRWANASDVYLVYDVDRSRTENLMPNGRESNAVSDSFDRGWAVYPIENVRGQTYKRVLYADRPEVRPPSMEVIEAMHSSQSVLHWIGEAEFAFLDRSNGVHRLVVADVSAGVTRPQVKTAVVNIAALPGWVRAETLTRLPDRDGAIVIKMLLRQESSPRATRAVEILVR